MQGFSIDAKFDGKVLIIRTTGYIDKNNGKELLDFCMSKVPGDFNGLILNFSNSPVINSSGLSQILDLVESYTRQYDIKIAVCGLSAIAKSAFRTCGIFTLVTEAISEEEALAKLIS